MFSLKLLASIGGCLLFSTFAVNAACPIFVTLSLSDKFIYDSNIVVNWGPECHNPPEWVGVFNEDPSVSNNNPQIRLTGISNTSGQIVTDMKVGKMRFPKGWGRNDQNAIPFEYPKGKCLPYFVASFNGNELLAVECLKIHPNWMLKMKDIAHIPLKDLFIPGTHASGAYINNYSKVKLPMSKDYAISQDFDVWSQLVFGIRYLDLSIGYKSDDIYDMHDAENFFIVNENMFINELHFVLDDIKRFVQLSNEVVIIDFSSFPIGFYKHPERHADLFHLIVRQIGDIAYERQDDTPCYQSSVSDVRAQGKSVMVLYPVEELPYPEREAKILCPSWKRFSTAFMNSSQTLDYMRLLFSKKENAPVQDEGWSFLAIQNLEQSLNTQKLLTAKERAKLVNPNVTNWLRGPWSLTANVVALDHFSNTNMIDVAIYANLHKAFNLANKNLVNFQIASN